MQRIIEPTADGSYTLFIPEMNEHYHSIKGAETESRHIFIDMGLRACAKTDELRIFEVGFGTGLNAWLSLQAGRESNQRLHYTTIELHPLPHETVHALQYSSDPLFQRLHEAPWDEEVTITPHFVLHKIKGDLTNHSFASHQPFHLVYFDAFAPEKQPEMWKQELFDNLYNHMTKGGILTTYCAKGVVRRTLQQAGFEVERLAGPPGGKREILRARV